MQTDPEPELEPGQHDAHIAVTYAAYMRWLPDPLDHLSGVEHPDGYEMNFRQLHDLCRADKEGPFGWDKGITNRERERYQKTLDPHYKKLAPFEGSRARRVHR